MINKEKTRAVFKTIISDISKHTIEERLEYLNILKSKIKSEKDFLELKNLIGDIDDGRHEEVLESIMDIIND